MKNFFLKHFYQRAANKSPITWNIQVNSVDAGQINDADYAKIQIKAFTNSQLYLLQFFNVLSFFGNVILYLLKTIPIVYFWCFLGLLFVAPEALSEAVSMFLTDVDKFTRGASQLATFITLGSTVFLLLMRFVFGHFFSTIPFGFRNLFGEKIAQSVRSKCGIQTDGFMVFYYDSADSYSAHIVHSPWTLKATS